MKGKATVQFIGGPADGRVEEVPRNSWGQLPPHIQVNIPRDIKFQTMAPDVAENIEIAVREVVYRLRADVGPSAIYDYDYEATR